MLSKNNVSEGERKLTSNPNRFSLRKLNIGVCSVAVGLAFLGINAHADQVNSNQQPATPTATVQTTQQTTQQQGQVALRSAVNDDNQTIKNAAAQSTEQSTDNTATVDAKAVAPAATNASQPAASQADATAQQDQVDVNAWDYTQRNDGIELNGFHGTIQNGQIVVPNSYDFTQAGIITQGQKVYIGAYFRRNTGNNGQDIHDQYGKQASAFIISHNGNGKVYAEGNWGDAFNGVQYKMMDLANLDVSAVTNMSQMFAWAQCQQLLGLENWDTSKVGSDHWGSMGSMFINCGNLTSLDLSNWDVSHVGNLSQMFTWDGQLKTVGDLSNWDVHNVTNMAAMFWNDGQLTSVGDLANWDVSHVTDMHYLFYNCPKLTTVGNLSKWDTSNVTNTNYMFAGAGITNLNISGWDLRKDADVNGMLCLNDNVPGSKFAAFINMLGVKVPTQTHFSIGSFDGTGKNLVVYSDDPTVLALNSQRGKVNQITVKTTSGQTIAVIPVDFAFNGKDDLIATLRSLTKKDQLNSKLESGKSIVDSDFDSDQSLKHDYSPAEANPLELVVAGRNGSVYTVSLQGPEYTQEIVYVDDNNQQVGTAEITGRLDENNQATIDAATINAQIASQMPQNYYLVSDQWTSAKPISSTQPSVIEVRVSNKAQVAVVYQTADGQVVKTDTVSGLVGQQKQLQFNLPDGYEAVNQLPDADYTFAVNNQPIVITVQKQAVIVDPDQPSKPSDPSQPTDPSDPQPSNPGQPTDPTNPQPTQPGQLVDPDSPQSVRPSQPAGANGAQLNSTSQSATSAGARLVQLNQTSSQKANHVTVATDAHQQGQKLPQTGNHQGILAVVLGAAAMLLSLGGAAGLRRHD